MNVMCIAAGLIAPMQQAFDEVMLSNDKLFVVLSVVLIIWIGLVAYVFALDRKLSRLEKLVTPQQSSESP